MKPEPVRRCAGCGRKAGKSEFVRIVRLPDKMDRALAFDPTLNLEGRSLYFCPSEECFEKLMRRKAPEKLMKATLPTNVREAIISFLSRAESAR